MMSFEEWRSYREIIEETAFNHSRIRSVSNFFFIISGVIALTAIVALVFYSFYLKGSNLK